MKKRKWIYGIILLVLVAAVGAKVLSWQGEKAFSRLIEKSLDLFALRESEIREGLMIERNSPPFRNRFKFISKRQFLVNFSRSSASGSARKATFACTMRRVGSLLRLFSTCQ
jgi:hypothetical protein